MKETDVKREKNAEETSQGKSHRAKKSHVGHAAAFSEEWQPRNAETTASSSVDRRSDKHSPEGFQALTRKFATLEDVLAKLAVGEKTPDGNIQRIGMDEVIERAKSKVVKIKWFLPKVHEKFPGSNDSDDLYYYVGDDEDHSKEPPHEAVKEGKSTYEKILEEQEKQLKAKRSQEKTPTQKVLDVLKGRIGNPIDPNLKNKGIKFNDKLMEASLCAYLKGNTIYISLKSEKIDLTEYDVIPERSDVVRQIQEKYPNYAQTDKFAKNGYALPLDVKALQNVVFGDEYRALQPRSTMSWGEWMSNVVSPTRAYAEQVVQTRTIRDEASSNIEKNSERHIEIINNLDKRIIEVANDEFDGKIQQKKQEILKYLDPQLSNEQIEQFAGDQFDQWCREKRDELEQSQKEAREELGKAQRETREELEQVQKRERSELGQAQKETREELEQVQKEVREELSQVQKRERSEPGQVPKEEKEELGKAQKEAREELGKIQKEVREELGKAQKEAREELGKIQQRKRDELEQAQKETKGELGQVQQRKRDELGALQKALDQLYKDKNAYIELRRKDLSMALAKNSETVSKELKDTLQSLDKNSQSALGRLMPKTNSFFSARSFFRI